MLDFRRLAYYFSDANGFKNNFNKSSKQAGKDWLALSLKRNPKVTLRKPEGTSFNKINSFIHGAVRRCLENLQLVMEKHEFVTSKITKADETGITAVQKT
jgi:hypothetical protein